jgi:hypothetical protein
LASTDSSSARAADDRLGRQLDAPLGETARLQARSRAGGAARSDEDIAFTLEAARKALWAIGKEADPKPATDDGRGAPGDSRVVARPAS